MKSSDVEQSLLKYKKEEFNNKFVNDSITYFKNKKLSELISDNEFELFGIKIYLLYNLKSYKFYFSEKKPKKFILMREIKLSEKQANNMINQLKGISKNDILICDKLKTETRKFYFFVLEKVDNEFNDSELKDNLYEHISLFLGLHVFYFLEHQNLENYCNENILSNSENSLKELMNFTKVYKTLTWTEKDKFMIFSGMIYQFLGTLYTQDLDIYYISGDDDNYKRYLSKMSSLDIFMVLKDKIIRPKKEAYSYEHNWIKYEIPKLVGVDNIYELFINPKHHFHFFGFKCIDIVVNIQRTMKRNSAFAIIDLMLLKSLNNIDYLKDFCLNNLGVRQGKMTVVNDEKLDKIYNTVVKYMKIWYNRDVKKEYLKEHIKKCDEIYKTIYYGEKKRTKNYVSGFNRLVVEHFLNKYAKGSKFLLDIGVGKGMGIPYYKKLDKDIKIVGLEPSIYSIETLKDFHKGDKDLTIIWGFGDKEWTKSEEVSKYKYDVIVLTFSIHYMIDNIDTLINNINNTTKKGATIIISLINGNKVFENLKYNKLEVTHRGDIMWGVYEYNDKIPKDFVTNFKMLFFMKDVYGLSNGSEENLVNFNYLKSKFSDYEMLEFKDHDKLINELDKRNTIRSQYQREILKYHSTLILKKK